jgi:hypothetical protein
LACIPKSAKDLRPDKTVLQKFQLALEYVHAVWSCQSPLAEETTRLDESMVSELFDVLGRLMTATMMYCMSSSAANLAPEGSRQSADTEFHAKSAWSLIRGHRYQVLEREFFKYVLEPHADALRQAYDMEYHAIADGIQKIADTFRTGLGNAAVQLFKRMKEANLLAETSGEGIEKIISNMKQSDPSYADEIAGYMQDMFCGGVSNLTRHSTLTEPLLEDLSYRPGENVKFYAEGEFVGTPMRTLPARERPGIKLGDQFFATDGQFIRDSAYRAIQWGLWKRLDYRDEWLKRQAKVIELAYPKIFVEQLRYGKIYSGVYFRDLTTGNWVETDLLVVLDDVLLVIEAKAGVLPMQSPAVNFASHARIIQELIVKAYNQCRRFIEYLASRSESQIFALINGEYVEIARLRRAAFRRIFPIGLTVEAFTPFSAMAKELAEVRPIVNLHPFISMSVDDLFVLNRFLPTTGSLFHYLEVRQQVAGIPKALLFDEIEHLGAYISKNRFDEIIREQLRKSDFVTLDSFGDVVDQHFEGLDWDTKPIPSQLFPEPLERYLEALDRLRPIGWLEIDSRIRDYDGDSRDKLGQLISDLELTLKQHFQRRFLFGGESSIQLWLCREDAFPSRQELERQAAVGCLAVGAPKMNVLIVGYKATREISRLACASIPAPSILRIDFGALQAEAQRQLRSGRMIELPHTKSGGKQTRKEK